MHGHAPGQTDCPAFDGIWKADDAVASDTEAGAVPDAALAGGTQRSGITRSPGTAS